jgi:hypothetical protein
MILKPKGMDTALTNNAHYEWNNGSNKDSLRATHGTFDRYLAALKAIADSSFVSLEQIVKAEFDNSPAIRAEFQDNLASYTAYRQAEAAGQTRILSC